VNGSSGGGEKKIESKPSGFSSLGGSGGICAAKTGGLYNIASDARQDAQSAADASAKQASAGAVRHKVDIIDDVDD